jgi:glycosyltransferase involved in cell wall biosynthesis
MCRMLPPIISVPGFRKGAVAGHVLDVTQRVNTLRYLYDTYQYLVAPTDFLYEAYVSNSFHPGRLRKINFGINLDLVRGYQRPKRKADSRVRFGYIGQLSSHKGADLLIKAFLQLKGDNGSLVLYGPQDQDPAYMQELFSLASENQRIEFRGTFPQTELPRRLSEIDVLVIPSRWYENSPLVLLYSLAVKTPVIATDVKGMSEFVRHGVNGFTFPMNSVEHLTKTMQHFIDDPRTIGRLSENAAYTKDVFNHANEVCALYDAAVKG